MAEKIKGKYIYPSVFVIILILNVFLIIKGVLVKKYYEVQLIEFQKKESFSKSLFIRDLALLSQNIYINFDSIYFGNIKDTCTYLIYAYSDNQCKSCIFEEIELIKAKTQKYFNFNVVVLPVLDSSRNVDIGLNAELSGINYKRIDKGLVKFPTSDDFSSVRFFAIKTPSGHIELPFFPVLGELDRTSSYLDFVYKKYFASK
jgi:hypothetical protein